MFFYVFDNLVYLILLGSGLNGTAICCQVNDQKRSKKDIFTFLIVSPFILNRIKKLQ
jgi:hypothetical protein